MRTIKEKTITLHGKKVRARVPRKLSPQERERVMIDLFDAIKKVAEGKNHRKAV